MSDDGNLVDDDTVQREVLNGQTPNSQTSTGHPPIGQTQIGHLTSGQPLIGQQSISQTLNSHPSVGRVPISQMSNGQKQRGQPPSHQPLKGQQSNSQTSIRQTPIGNIPTFRPLIGPLIIGHSFVSAPKFCFPHSGRPQNSHPRIGMPPIRQPRSNQPSVLRTPTPNMPNRQIPIRQLFRMKPLSGQELSGQTLIKTPYKLQTISGQSPSRMVLVKESENGESVKMEMLSKDPPTVYYVSKQNMQPLLGTNELSGQIERGEVPIMQPMGILQPTEKPITIQSSKSHSSSNESKTSSLECPTTQTSKEQTSSSLVEKPTQSMKPPIQIDLVNDGLPSLLESPTIQTPEQMPSSRPSGINMLSQKPDTVNQANLASQQTSNEQTTSSLVDNQPRAIDLLSHKPDTEFQAQSVRQQTSNEQTTCLLTEKPTQSMNRPIQIERDLVNNGLSPLLESPTIQTPEQMPSSRPSGINMLSQKADTVTQANLASQQTSNEQTSSLVDKPTKNINMPIKICLVNDDLPQNNHQLTQQPPTRVSNNKNVNNEVGTCSSTTSVKPPIAQTPSTETRAQMQSQTTSIIHSSNTLSEEQTPSKSKVVVVGTKKYNKSCQTAFSYSSNPQATSQISKQPSQIQEVPKDSAQKFSKPNFVFRDPVKYNRTLKRQPFGKLAQGCNTRRILKPKRKHLISHMQSTNAKSHSLNQNTSQSPGTKDLVGSAEDHTKVLCKIPLCSQVQDPMGVNYQKQNPVILEKPLKHQTNLTQPLGTVSSQSQSLILQDPIELMSTSLNGEQISSMKVPIKKDFVHCTTDQEKTVCKQFTNNQPLVNQASSREPSSNTSLNPNVAFVDLTKDDETMSMQAPRSKAPIRASTVNKEQTTNNEICTPNSLNLDRSTVTQEHFSSQKTASTVIRVPSPILNEQILQTSSSPLCGQPTSSINKSIKPNVVIVDLTNDDETLSVQAPRSKASISKDQTTNSEVCEPNSFDSPRDGQKICKQTINSQESANQAAPTSLVQKQIKNLDQNTVAQEHFPSQKTATTVTRVPSSILNEGIVQTSSSCRGKPMSSLNKSIKQNVAFVDLTKGDEILQAPRSKVPISQMPSTVSLEQSSIKQTQTSLKDSTVIAAPSLIPNVSIVHAPNSLNGQQMSSLKELNKPNVVFVDLTEDDETSSRQAPNESNSNMITKAKQTSRLNPLQSCQIQCSVKEDQLLQPLKELTQSASTANIKPQSQNQPVSTGQTSSSFSGESPIMKLTNKPEFVFVHPTIQMPSTTAKTNLLDTSMSPISNIISEGQTTSASDIVPMNFSNDKALNRQPPINQELTNVTKEQSPSLETPISQTPSTVNEEHNLSDVEMQTEPDLVFLELTIDETALSGPSSRSQSPSSLAPSTVTQTELLSQPTLKCEMANTIRKEKLPCTRSSSKPKLDIVDLTLDNTTRSSPNKSKIQTLIPIPSNQISRFKKPGSQTPCENKVRGQSQNKKPNSQASRRTEPTHVNKTSRGDKFVKVIRKAQNGKKTVHYLRAPMNPIRNIVKKEPVWNSPSVSFIDLTEDEEAPSDKPVHSDDILRESGKDEVAEKKTLCMNKAPSVPIKEALCLDPAFRDQCIISADNSFIPYEMKIRSILTKDVLPIKRTNNNQNGGPTNKEKSPPTSSSSSEGTFDGDYGEISSEEFDEEGFPRVPVYGRSTPVEISDKESGREAFNENVAEEDLSEEEFADEDCAEEDVIEDDVAQADDEEESDEEDVVENYVDEEESDEEDVADDDVEEEESAEEDVDEKESAKEDVDEKESAKEDVAEDDVDKKESTEMDIAENDVDEKESGEKEIAEEEVPSASNCPSKPKEMPKDDLNKTRINKALANYYATLEAFNKLKEAREDKTIETPEQERPKTSLEYLYNVPDMGHYFYPNSKKFQKFEKEIIQKPGEIGERNVRTYTETVEVKIGDTRPKPDKVNQMHEKPGTITEVVRKNTIEVKEKWENIREEPKKTGTSGERMYTEHVWLKIEEFESTPVRYYKRNEEYFQSSAEIERKKRESRWLSHEEKKQERRERRQQNEERSQHQEERNKARQLRNQEREERKTQQKQSETEQERRKRLEEKRKVYALRYSNKYRREKEKKNGSAPVITFSINLSENGFLSPTIIRNDGRTWKQHRNVYIECGPTSDVSATAYIQMGGTKVLALVTGLSPMPEFRQFEAVKYLNFQVKLCRYFFNYKPDDMKGKNEEKAIVENLSRALEPAILQDMIGNVQVNVEVIVIDNDGNPTSACVLASSLALFHGKIPMKDLVSSATLAVLPTGIILVDPTRNEKRLALPKDKNPKRMNKEQTEQSSTQIKGKDAEVPRDKHVERVKEQMLREKDSNENPSHPYGLFNLSFMPKCNEVSAPCIYGDIPRDTLVELAPILKEECVKIYEKMRNLLEEIEQNKDIRRCHKIPEIYEDIKSFYAEL